MEPVWDLYHGVLGTIDYVYISLVGEQSSSMFCNETMPVCMVSLTSSCCWGSLLLSKGDMEEMAVLWLFCEHALLSAKG